MKNLGIVGVIGLTILTMGLVAFLGATLEAAESSLSRAPTDALVVDSTADSGAGAAYAADKHGPVP